MLSLFYLFFLMSLAPREKFLSGPFGSQADLGIGIHVHINYRCLEVEIILDSIFHPHLYTTYVIQLLTYMVWYKLLNIR